MWTWIKSLGMHTSVVRKMLPYYSDKLVFIYEMEDNKEPNNAIRYATKEKMFKKQGEDHSRYSSLWLVLRSVLCNKEKSFIDR